MILNFEINKQFEVVINNKEKICLKEFENKYGNADLRDNFILENNIRVCMTISNNKIEKYHYEL